MTEKTLSRDIIYEGKVITMRVDEVELEDGTTSSREVVEHPGAAAVLAVTREKEVYFVRQFRKPIEKELLEIPAGKLDPNESPRQCAERELGEEIGMTAGDFRLLAAFYTSPGFSDEKLYLYLATGLRPVQAERPADEFLQISKMPLAEAVAMARKGELEDAKTIIALLMAADLGLTR